MKGLLASSVCVILALLILSVQGKRGKEDGGQDTEDIGPNVKGIKPIRRECSSNDAIENALCRKREGKSTTGHEKTRSASQSQETEGHESRSSSQKGGQETLTRKKRGIELPEDDISLDFGSQGGKKRKHNKSAKLKLAAVCKSGKASRKLLRAIMQNPEEDSGEQVSFMDVFKNPPLESKHAENDHTSPSNGGEETNMAQVNPDVGTSSTDDTGIENGSEDKIDPDGINNIKTNASLETSKNDKTAPSVGPLGELKGEAGRGQHGIAGVEEAGKMVNENRPNNVSEDSDLTEVLSSPENQGPLSTYHQQAEVGGQSNGDNNSGTPISLSGTHNNGIQPGAGMDKENSWSVQTPASLPGTNSPTKEDNEMFETNAATNADKSILPSATNGQQTIGSNDMPISLSTNNINGLPDAEGKYNINDGQVGTPNSHFNTELNLPATQNGETFLPLSTTNQLIGRPSLQSQSEGYSNGLTPLGKSDMYANGVPQHGAIGEDDESGSSIRPTSSESSTQLNRPTTQNEDPALSNIGTSSLSHSTSADGKPLDMSAIYNNGVLPAAGTSDENIGYTATPNLQFSAGLDGTPNGGASFSPSYSPANQLPYGSIGPNHQSQSLEYGSNNITPIGTSSAYVNGVPQNEAIEDDDESSRSMATPNTQFGTQLNFQTTQNGIYDYNGGNPTNSNPGTLSSPYSSTNQQLLSSIRPPIANNINGNPLGMSASYNNGISPIADTDHENSGYIGTPNSQFSFGTNPQSVQNGDSPFLPNFNQQMGASFSPYSSPINQLPLGSIGPNHQSQSLEYGSNGTPLGTSSVHVNGIPQNEGIGDDDESSRSMATPNTQFGTQLNLPTNDNGAIYGYNGGNPTDSNTGILYSPYSTTNQQVLSSIRPPIVGNSNGNPMGMSSSFNNGISPMEGTNQENTGYIGTPISQFSIGNGETSLPFLATNQQLDGSIRPQLQSQSQAYNSNVNPQGMPGSNIKGIPQEETTDDEDESGRSISTPYAQFSTQLNMPIMHGGETHNSGGSNPISLPYSTANQQMLIKEPPIKNQSVQNNSDGTPLNIVGPESNYESDGYKGSPGSFASSDQNVPSTHNIEASSTPISTANQQMLSMRPPLQSLSQTNSLSTPSGISGSYDNEAPALLGTNNENKGYLETPNSQFGVGMNLPNGDKNIPTVTNSEIFSSPYSINNQEKVLGMTSTNINGLPEDDEDETSRSLATPNLSTTQNGDSNNYNGSKPIATNASSTPYTASSHQIFGSIIPPPESQSLVDEGTALEKSDTYDNEGPQDKGTDNEDSRSQGNTPSTDLSLLSTQNGLTSSSPYSTTNQQMFDSIKPPIQSPPLDQLGASLGMSSTNDNGVPQGTVTDDEDNGSTGSTSSSGLNSPSIQNGLASSSPFTSTNQQTLGSIMPPVELQSHVNTDDKPSGLSAPKDSINKDVTTSFELERNEPVSPNNNSTLLGYSPSIKDGRHQEVMLEGNQKLNPSIIASELENNPNYTAWRESNPANEGLTRPRCVCTCDGNQHFFIK